MAARKRSGGRLVIKLDPPVERGDGARGTTRGASRAPARQLLRLPAPAWTWSRRAAAGSARCGRSLRGSRTTFSSSTPGSRCRCVEECVRESTSRRAQSSSQPASSTTDNLSALADRCLHARSARLRLADRAASARKRARHRDRPAAVRLPRYDAARRTARSTTRPTAAAPGWCCGSTSSQPRSMRCTAACPSTG